MTPLVLFLLCLTAAHAQIPVQKTIYAFEGQFLLLYSGVGEDDYPPVLWQKRSPLNESYWEDVATGTTILVHTLNIQITSSGALLIDPATIFLTNGTWRVCINYKDTNSSTYVILHVIISASQPVLMPKRLLHSPDYAHPQAKLGVVCVDLAKDDIYDAYIQLGQHTRLVHHWVTLRHKNENTPTSGWLKSYPGDTCSTSIKVRCCSDSLPGTKCSNWTNIRMNNFLYGPQAGQRRWCPKIKHTDAKLCRTHAHLHTLSPLEGQCSWPSANGTAYSTRLACPYTDIKLRAWKTALTWERPLIHGLQNWTQIMNTSHIQTTPQYIMFFNVSSQDTDQYRFVGTNQSVNSIRSNFKLWVVNRFRAAIQLLYADNYKIMLQCVHTPYVPTNIEPWFRWDIRGSIHKHWQEGPYLILYPDCWHSIEWWHYLFAVRCHVFTPNWSASSDLFTGSGFRLSSFEPPSCHNKKHIQWERRVPLLRYPMGSYRE